MTEFNMALSFNRAVSNPDNLEDEHSYTVNWCFVDADVFSDHCAHAGGTHCVDTDAHYAQFDQLASAYATANGIDDPRG